MELKINITKDLIYIWSFPAPTLISSVPSTPAFTSPECLDKAYCQKIPSATNVSVWNYYYLLFSFNLKHVLQQQFPKTSFSVFLTFIKFFFYTILKIESKKPIFTVFILCSNTAFIDCFILIFLFPFLRLYFCFPNNLKIFSSSLNQNKFYVNQSSLLLQFIILVHALFNL